MALSRLVLGLPEIRAYGEQSVNSWLPFSDFQVLRRVPEGNCHQTSLADTRTLINNPGFTLMLITLTTTAIGVTLDG